MKLFHIFTVTPIDVSSHQVPTVQYGDYFITSTSLDEAKNGLKKLENVIGASEVYGKEIVVNVLENGVIVGPENMPNKRKSLDLHRQWANQKNNYILLSSAAESLEQFFARSFAKDYAQISVANYYKSGQDTIEV